MEVNFTIDEKGNVGEEEEVALYNKHFFYYYDDKNRLTDIVHYNAIKKKVSPDFIFEYNEEGQLGQMISVGEGVNSSYSIWRYYYTNNLRTEERCFSEDKKLMGYFIYEYK
ncbi:MAG: hypothetical protein HY305_07380 [Sphingobacteriales bacterium]|nr:hypothetical protein [Sphingobacteriales bacterium]